MVINALGRDQNKFDNKLSCSSVYRAITALFTSPRI